MRLLNPVAKSLFILFSTSALAQLSQAACLETEVDSFVTSEGAIHLAEITAPALGGDARDFLRLEFYASNDGVFDLGSGNNSNYSSCVQCVLAYVDEGAGSFFFQTAGSVSVNGDPTKSVLDAEISDVTLVEVTIDPATYVSTPVPDGICLHILSARLVTDSTIFRDGFE